MQPRSDVEVVGNYVPNAGRVQARNSTLLKPRAEIRGKSEKALTANEKTILNYRCAVDACVGSTGATIYRRVRRLRSPPRLPGQLGHIHPKRDRLLSCKLCFNPGNAALRRSSHRTALRWLQKGPPPMKKLGVFLN